jgi:hypothetical protein
MMAMLGDMKCSRCAGTEYPLDPSGICWGCLIDDLRVALSASRAEVERLSRVEAAAKAWEEWPVSLDSDIPPDVVAMKIRQGIIPNGKPVKP